MKSFRIPALVAVTALAFTACNQEGEVANQSAGNPLLAHVPADTPYLFANIEPTPPEVIDAFMLRLAPSLATAQSLLDDFKIEINTDDPGEHSEARLLSAVLAEFDGKLNREGLESIGLSMESHKVIYGMGVFPVVRIALKDADALRAAIGRIEASSGMTFTQQTAAETNYWKISDGSRHGAVYIAILDDHVAFSIFPTAAEEEWLPAFLGQALPANALGGSGTLAQLNKEKGYSNYGSGFLDLQRMAAELLDENSKTVALLKNTGHYNLADLDPVCASEIKGLIAKAPRMTGGTTELTATTVAMRYDLELDLSLAGKLAALVAQVPVASNSQDKVFSAALGLRMGRVKDFAKEQASAVTAIPFQCEQMKDLNIQAQAMLDALNQPMPPFINNLKGFRVSLDEVDFENFKPENTRGIFSLEVEKPQMLVGMAQMFVPGMGDLALEPGADPVELPQELLSFSSGNLQVFAAMGSDSIGFAVGKDKRAELASFMDASADNDGTFFSIDYDMAAPIEFQRKMGRQFSGTGHGDTEELNELVESIQSAYMNWLGRSRVEVSFNGKGLQIDSKMTFK